MRAGIYIRVSTEEQAQHGYSAAEQEEAGRKRAGALVLPGEPLEVFVFADLGYSGATLARPKLAELREWVRQGKLDVLIVRDPDRLSRKLAHQLLLTEEFEKSGVRLEFLDFAWQDTPEGRLFYSIRGAIAEYEREKIRERLARGKLQKARQGGVPVGFQAYGYKYDPEAGRVAVNEEEAVVVQKIFLWFATEDIGIRGIAERLNAAGIPTKKRRGWWHRQVIRQILANPVYKGEWIYRSGGRRGGGEEPREKVVIPVPPLVSPEVWEKAQEKLAHIRRLWAGKGKRSYLLSGLLTCGDCGLPMAGVFASFWGERKRRYTCARSRPGPRGCRPAKFVAAEVLEEIVWREVKAVLHCPEDLAREAAANLSRAEEVRREMSHLKRLLAEVKKGRAAVRDALASGLLELDAETREKLAALKERKERLEARIAALEEDLRAAGGLTPSAGDLLALAARVLGQMDAFAFGEKRALVRALVREVVVSGRPKPGYPPGSLDEVRVTIFLKVEGGSGVAPSSSRQALPSPLKS